jgi:hypothetical protein
MKKKGHNMIRTSLLACSILRTFIAPLFICHNLECKSRVNWNSEENREGILMKRDKFSLSE